MRIDCVNDKSKFEWKTPSFSLTNFGGYFNITKTPASDITVFYILLKEFRLFLAFSTINPFAPEPPVTTRADPGPFYPLWRDQF